MAKFPGAQIVDVREKNAESADTAADTVTEVLGEADAEAARETEAGDDF